jgi:hypothetical protein
VYAHCVYCPEAHSCDSADEAESWATRHENWRGKHSVKVEGYEELTGEHNGKA